MAATVTAPKNRPALTREGWLAAAVEHLRKDFAEAGEPLPPKVNVSVGWPGGRGNKANVIGQCWHPSACADKAPAIFVSPRLSDPVDVLAVLVHELVHAAGHQGHRKGFRRLALAVGLTGRMTATVPTEELATYLRGLANRLGPYGHAAIQDRSTVRLPGVPGGKDGDPEPRMGTPKQTTRMLKLECPCCGYTVRTTRKWLEQGLPRCPSSVRLQPDAKARQVLEAEGIHPDGLV